VRELVLAGVDLVTVKELMGHADIKVTMRYAHPTPESKRKAVDLLVCRNRTSRLLADGGFSEKVESRKALNNMEAAPGFEPGNNGFADRRLRPLGYAASGSYAFIIVRARDS
jgi:hypothetical protein